MPGSAPMVSIVIPCHGYARYLPEAIESALAQTHPQIEVIVVDDGSPDDCADVAARYPVRVIRQPQSGVCVAADQGIAASRGAYVLRLDADDILEPAYVEETLRALDADPGAHFAYTHARWFGDRAGVARGAEFDAESLAERNYVHVSALMRRDAYARAGGYRPNAAWTHCEDWDLWLRFADAGMRGVLVPSILLRYRQHRAGPGPNEPQLSAPWAIRAVRIAADLQDHHPDAFAPALLVRRLATLPRRLARGQVSYRHAVVVACFYGVMLLRVALGLARSRVRARSGSWRPRRADAR